MIDKLFAFLVDPKNSSVFIQLIRVIARQLSRPLMKRPDGGRKLPRRRSKS